ncbi:MAG: hypothetical protein Ta2B_09920 [Termitinemataceae bacterium]|nr:MAG: hypothetical protein Ta2B_09920 [Termitinemataceae bacterium]
MEKIILIITYDDLQKINLIRLHSKVLKERQKAAAIYWRAKGKTEKQIHELTELSVVTIIRHIKKYNKLGFDYLKENNYKGNTSDLEAYSELIITDFNKQCPATIEEAGKRIEKLVGIKRGAASITVFLKKRGFRTKAQEVFRQKQTKTLKNNS